MPHERVVISRPNSLSSSFISSVVPRPGEDLHRAVADFLSGMTDRFALETWEKVFMPRPWAIV